MAEYANLLYELRKNKGMTPEEAGKLARNPLYLGCLMIKNGDADGELAGAQNTTGNVLRPAFQIIKTKPGIKVVSGAMLMFTPTPQYGHNGVLVFADIAVNPNPTADEPGADCRVCRADGPRGGGLRAEDSHAELLHEGQREARTGGQSDGSHPPGQGKWPPTCR